MSNPIKSGPVPNSPEQCSVSAFSSQGVSAATQKQGAASCDRGGPSRRRCVPHSWDHFNNSPVANVALSGQSRRPERTTGNNNNK